MGRVEAAPWRLAQEARRMGRVEAAPWLLAQEARGVELSTISTIDVRQFDDPERSKLCFRVAQVLR